MPTGRPFGKPCRKESRPESMVAWRDGNVQKMVEEIQLSEEGTPTAKGIKPSGAVWGGSVLWCQGVDQSPVLPQTQMEP